MSEVRWIGTGRMGGAMVRRPLAAGHGVHVWNRTRSKAEAIAGAKVADVVGDLAGLDVVFATVADDASLRRVILDEGGLLRERVAPHLLVDASTVGSETSERIRAAAPRCSPPRSAGTPRWSGPAGPRSWPPARKPPSFRSSRCCG